MRYAAFLLALVFCGCQKDETGTGSKDQLVAIKTGGKIYQSFTYTSDGLLAKEQWFGFCETTPADEFMYSYTGSRLDTIATVTRSLYSSTASICDPAKGLRSYAVAAYDNQNRLVRFNRSTGDTRTYQYNAQGFVERQTISFPGSGDIVINYKRDANGNIIEESDSQGHKTQYEFDTKINPYYRIKQQNDIITPFYNSPNNVVKIKPANGNTTELRYDYNQRGLPVKMLDNGTAYAFVYR